MPQALAFESYTSKIKKPDALSDFLILVELAARYSKQANAWEHLAKALRSIEKMQVREPEPPTEPLARFRLDQRLDAETIAQLVADYQAGASTNQLMQDYGIGKGSVLRLLAEAGVRMRNQSLSPADLPEAIELYRSGLSLKKVGDHFGLSDDAVRGAFLRAGVQLRPRPGWNYDA